jgi:hypothetical protein
MKKIVVIAFILVMAMALFTACGEAKDGNDSTNPTESFNNGGKIVPGVLSLAALKKAADDTGYTKYQGMSTVSNKEDTLPKPVEGFTIGIVDDRSTSYNIAINEFASEKDAGEYAGYIDADSGFGNAHLSGKFTAVFIGSAAASAEPGLMAAFKAAGWTDDTIPPYTPPAPERSASMEALVKAAEDRGYTVSNDYYFSSFNSSVEPVGGFKITYSISGSAGDLDFLEFASAADAKAYKAAEDAPDDMFPKDCVINGKFVVRLTLGFSSDSEVRELVNSISKAAGM